MSSADRRKHSRVKTQDVAGHVRVKDEVLAFGLPIDNISMGGLFVVTSEPLPLGTPLQMELTQPGLAPPIKVMGTVVLTISGEHAETNGARPGMGVRFDPLAPDVSKRLSRMLVALVAREVDVGAGHGGGSPTTVDDETAVSRKAFDFGFVSLESFPEDSTATVAGPATDPGAHRAIAGFEVPRGAGPQPAVKVTASSAPTSTVSAPSPAAVASDGARQPVQEAPGQQRTPPPAGAAASTGTSAPAAGRSPSQGPRPGQYQPPQRVAVTLDPASARVGTAAGPASQGRPSGAGPAVPPLPENARLLVQIRGLLEDLGETQSELHRRSREIDDLSAELRRLKDELRRRDERIAALEERLARAGGKEG